MKFLRIAILTLVLGAALGSSAVMAQYPPPGTPTPHTPPPTEPTPPVPAAPNTGEGSDDGDSGFNASYLFLALGGVAVAGAGAYVVYGGTRR